jgi:hypothetical protein
MICTHALYIIINYYKTILKTTIADKIETFIGKKLETVILKHRVVMSYPENIQAFDAPDPPVINWMIFWVPKVIAMPAEDNNAVIQDALPKNTANPTDITAIVAIVFAIPPDKIEVTLHRLIPIVSLLATVS